MSNTTFAGSVPENYDRYLRPVLFESYATDVAGRVMVKPALRLLEVACGTGIVTRQLLSRLPDDAVIVATDISEPMIGVAQQRVPPDSRVSWQPADALSLPFDDASFDAVVCQFGVMFFPDKAKGLREMHRVLKPGGQLLLSTWDTLERNPLVAVVHEALAQAFPAAPPTFLAIPYGYYDRDAIQEVVSGAGFKTVELHQVNLSGHSPSAADAASGFVTGTPLVPEMKEKGLSLEVAHAAVTRAIAARFGDGAITAPMAAILVAATR